MRTAFAVASRLFALAALMAPPDPSAAQQVQASTRRNACGEPVVRVETTLRPSPEAAWHWFSTEAGLSCRAAPVVRFDLRTGGALETSYDKAAGIGGAGTITLPILNHVDHEALTFKVTLNDAFSERLRSEDGQLQEVIQLQRLPTGGTRVVSSMVGWGRGAEWDKAIAFFAKGNEWSCQKLAECAARSP